MCQAWLEVRGLQYISQPFLPFPSCVVSQQGWGNEPGKRPLSGLQQG